MSIRLTWWIDFLVNLNLNTLICAFANFSCVEHDPVLVLLIIKNEAKHDFDLERLLIEYGGLWVTGRQMIDHTKKLVQERFTTANSYSYDAEVRH